MTILLTFFVFVFGLIIGSFLNVVILRYGTGRGIFGVDERSMCFSCAKTLHWYELIPVVSFLFLRGKCSECKTKISWQYPLVELATGILFASIFAQNFSGFSVEGFFLYNGVSSLIGLTLLQWLVWAILVVITVYDFRHKIIPDALVYIFSGVSLCIAFFFSDVVGGTFLNSITAGIAFFGFFAGLWLVSGGRWLGFGDAKLVLGVGFLLGLVRGLSALAFAFWIGAVVSVVLLVWQYMRTRAIQSSGLQGQSMNLTMKSEIPFAPFIILGTLISYFWYVDVFGIAAFF